MREVIRASAASAAAAVVVGGRHGRWGRESNGLAADTDIHPGFEPSRHTIQLLKPLLSEFVCLIDSLHSEVINGGKLRFSIPNSAVNSYRRKREVCMETRLYVRENGGNHHIMALHAHDDTTMEVRWFQVSCSINPNGANFDPSSIFITW